MKLSGPWERRWEGRGVEEDEEEEEEEVEEVEEEVEEGGGGEGKREVAVVKR